ncbi:hypothetical protein F511_37324 [Dorcoceras hygrometricum]|uniref:Uncharacterized protein n=1 Tax=Dorcoceras hygrometricum TaxID=472368 RepID=A0A2Z7CXU3_9LAMI|nr:hypothetical protein F511_37324 [Dorcoceras hygrometricum]
MLRFVYGSSELNLLCLPYFRNGKDPLEDFDYSSPCCNLILRPASARTPSNPLHCLTFANFELCSTRLNILASSSIRRLHKLIYLIWSNTYDLVYQLVSFQQFFFNRFISELVELFKALFLSSLSVLVLSCSCTQLLPIWFVLNELGFNLLPIAEQILYLRCSLSWYASEFFLINAEMLQCAYPALIFPYQLSSMETDRLSTQSLHLYAALDLRLNRSALHLIMLRLITALLFHQAGEPA